MRNSVVAITLLSLLSGCATGPVPRWEAPKAENTVPTYSMDFAKAYAHNARRAYQKAIDDEVLRTGNLGSALIVLGGALVGAGIGDAHRDVLVGGGLVGATAYGVNNWNSAKPRLPLYQAGIEGFNCALRVVAPLDMPDLEYKALIRSIAEVDMALPQAQASINRTRDLVRLFPQGAEAVAQAEASLSSAVVAVQSATSALVKGRQLAQKVRSAGSDLVLAIDRIDTEVQKAGLSTIPDISAVRSVIAGLPQAILSFAPQPGIREQFLQAFAPQKPAGSGSQSLPADTTKSQQLSAAVDELNAKAGALNDATTRLLSPLEAYDTSATTAALKDCGAADIGTPMRSVPEMLAFSGAKDQRLPLFISGGKPQYNATVEPSDSFSVSGPTLGGSVIQVTATRDLTTDVRAILTVGDSTQPTQQKLSVPILVSAVSGFVMPSSGNVGAGGNVTLQQVAEELNLTRTYTITDPKVTLTVHAQVGNNQNEIEVTVTCNPASEHKLDSTAVRETLLRGNIGKKFLKEGSANKQKLRLISTPTNCIGNAGEVAPAGS